MIALARAELIKLRSTRMLGWLLIGTLAMVLVTIAASVPSTGSTNPPTSLDDPALLARMVGVSFLWPQLTVALLGVLAYTQEERHGTITSTRLVEPRPHRVLAAKAGALVARQCRHRDRDTGRLDRRDHHADPRPRRQRNPRGRVLAGRRRGVRGPGAVRAHRSRRRHPGPQPDRRRDRHAGVAHRRGAPAHRGAPAGRPVDARGRDGRVAAARRRGHDHRNAAEGTHRRTAPRRVHGRRRWPSRSSSRREGTSSRSTAWTSRSTPSSLTPAPILDGLFAFPSA